MRAIKIDPVTRTVEAIDTPAKLDDMYKLIECNLIEAVEVGGGNVLWLDEEGLLKEPTKPFFAFAGLEETPYCGIGLILGSRKGDNAPCGLAVSDVFAKVVWLDIELVGMEQFETTTMWMGEETPVFGSRPVFRPKPKEGEEQ